MNAIVVEDLVVLAGDVPLLGPVSFQIARGATLVVMGETGAGKSLIAQAILGTLPAGLRSNGIIEINGRRVDTLTTPERASLWGREITTLPQEPWRALGPLMAAWRQVHETHRYVANLDGAHARNETAKELVSLGLDGAESRLPSALSGGMAQRVAFAAATAGRAPVLLADEPTKGLDSERQTRVTDLLSDVPKHGGTLLAITHEGAVAEVLGGSIVILREGRVVEQGETRAVLAHPKAAYTRDLLAADPKAWQKAEPASRGDMVLRAENLAVSRNKRILIEDFSLALQAGERVAICGPSGIGKTSLLDTLAGLVKPVKGHVEHPHGFIHGVQKLYQDPPAAFPPHISLGQNLRDVARLHRVAWERVMAYLSDLNLHQALLQRRPDAVSGGELQRLSLVRALTVNPKVLLADEPTSRLDPITQYETLEMLAKAGAEKGIAIVLVTHNVDIAEKWADRTIHL